MSLPILFIGHGNPMNALEDNRFTQDWQRLAGNIAPKAIVVISAHWCTQGVKVTAQPTLETIHDFYGFPPQLFAMQYPSPGSPELAQRIQQAISAAPVALDNSWGLDHGSWSVLCKLFPNADIPVVQLSLDLSLPMTQHYAIGQQLAALREEGVLIIGSGNVVHNIPKWMSNPNGPSDWAKVFDDAIYNAVMSQDHQTLLDYHTLPNAQEAVPTVEHYLPLIYCAAASGIDSPVTSSEFGDDTLENVCMRSYRFH